MRRRGLCLRFAAFFMVAMSARVAHAQTQDFFATEWARPLELHDIGRAIAAEGDLVVVGAPAFIYSRATGQIVRRLESLDDSWSREGFGSAVDIHDGMVIVGAPNSGTGTAYLFEAESGTRRHRLIPPDGAVGDRFGCSVALWGGLAIVGAEYHAASGIYAGAVYIFDVATGAMISKLLPAQVSAVDQFGASIAADAGVLAVGAPGDDDRAVEAGAVYLFNLPNGGFRGKLVASDGISRDYLGRAVAIEGATIAAGASGHDQRGSNAGAVYLFESSSTQTRHKIVPDDLAAGDAFGASVALGDGMLAAGGEALGRVYLFDSDSGASSGRLLRSWPLAGDSFGQSLAVARGTIIAGAKDHPDGGDAVAAAHAPLIANHPTDALAGPMPALIEFTVAARFPAGATYRWRKDGLNLTDGNHITGSETPRLQILATGSDTGLYDCVVQLPFGDAVSEVAVLAFRSGPCPPDLNNDAVLNFFDITTFLSGYAAGCTQSP
jgi:hypothetical protein